jgi:hypothetical protein
MSVINWEKLEHAYGTAENIPALLEKLASYPSEDSYEDEPWFSLWSSLYHQGDIYSASFAAVLEIIRYLSLSPQEATFSFFALPASVEIARAKNKISVPSEISNAYFDSIKGLASLASAVVEVNANPVLCRAATAAFTVSVGLYNYAEIILEIDPEELPEVLDWYWNR